MQMISHSQYLSYEAMNVWAVQVPQGELEEQRQRGEEENKRVQISWLKYSLHTDHRPWMPVAYLNFLIV